MENIKILFPNLSQKEEELLAGWAVLLRQWNEKINLISRKDIEHLEERHLAPCLAITNHLKLMQGTRVMDVGTGGGFPGLIMAICYPQAQFTLVDSIGKKVAVVQDIAEQLGLRNVKVQQARVESIQREFDFITGRAVKNLPEYFGWIQGNLRRGQRNSLPNGVLYWKGGDLAAEYAAIGIKPRSTIDLQSELQDPYFADKYILHFDARDVPRARVVTAQ